MSIFIYGLIDPFAGIGSTGVQALKMGRQFIGVELKEDYHRLGVKYLQDLEFQLGQPNFLHLLDEEEVAA